MLPTDSHNAASGAAAPARLSLAIRGAGVLLILVALGTAAVLASRRGKSTATEAAQLKSDQSGGPMVRAATVVLSPASHHLVLLGETHPFASVTLYAKVSGYLKSITVDKGDLVKINQLLAVIESPETDAAWSAAKADHDQKALTASRIKQLLDRKFVSQEESDQAAADAAIASERLESLAQQREFENIRAPFDGTVTARFADPGALVQNAASSQTSALPVVDVERTDSLRIYTYLDQADAESVHDGLQAVLTMDERPDMRMPVRVSRTSGVLDQTTRKLLVEFDVANAKGQIVPGSFVHIEIDLPSPSLPQIPAEALVVRQGQTLVPVLSADSAVHFRKVTVANSDGQLVRLLGGLQPGERVVLNVGDGITEGAHVRPASDSTAQGAHR